MQAESNGQPGEQPCIRCGECAVVCPVQLHPQQLLVHLQEWHLQAAERERTLDCTECGLCDAACPSRIPLLQRYREAKQLIQAAATRRDIAMAARERYRARQLRLGREEEERTERHAERSATLASGDAVAAAVARAQARRAALRNESKE